MNQEVFEGYVFLCSNSTEKECYDRFLFGGKEKYKKEIPSITLGDKLFLYNYQEGLLHGIFKAVSEAKENIQPDAWKGEFPWQVKVELIKKYHPLSRADLIDVLPFIKNKYPPAKLSSEQLSKLETTFYSKKRLPFFKDSIPYVCDDGHKVRSKGELLIDNWLYQNGILHAYEKQLESSAGTPETMYCDFFIPGSNTYIEFWGLKDKAYTKRKEEKLNFYRLNNINLIEVFPENLKEIDELLKPLLIK
jgi:hypothetical protein